MFGRFNVKAAKRILKASPRESVNLNVADYAAMRKMLAGVSYASVDMDVPVIVVKVNGGFLPIDGWSRIAKALETGQPSVPAVQLTSQEAQSVRLS
jgi:hypothetical protein